MPQHLVAVEDNQFHALIAQPQSELFRACGRDAGKVADTPHDLHARVPLLTFCTVVRATTPIPRLRRFCILVIDCKRLRGLDGNSMPGRVAMEVIQAVAVIALSLRGWRSGVGSASAAKGGASNTVLPLA